MYIYDIDVVRTLGDLQYYDEYQGELLKDITDLNIIIDMYERIRIRLPQNLIDVHEGFIKELFKDVLKYIDTIDEFKDRIEIVGNYKKEDMEIINTYIENLYEDA